MKNVINESLNVPEWVDDAIDEVENKTGKSMYFSAVLVPSLHYEISDEEFGYLEFELIKDIQIARSIAIKNYIRYLDSDSVDFWKLGINKYITYLKKDKLFITKEKLDKEIQSNYSHDVLKRMVDKGFIKINMERFVDEIITKFGIGKVFNPYEFENKYEILSNGALLIDNNIN